MSDCASSADVRVVMIVVLLLERCSTSHGVGGGDLNWWEVILFYCIYEELCLVFGSWFDVNATTKHVLYKDFKVISLAKSSHDVAHAVRQWLGAWPWRVETRVCSQQTCFK